MLLLWNRTFGATDKYIHVSLAHIYASVTLTRRWVTFANGIHKKTLLICDDCTIGGCVINVSVALSNCKWMQSGKIKEYKCKSHRVHKIQNRQTIRVIKYITWMSKHNARYCASHIFIFISLDKFHFIILFLWVQSIMKLLLFEITAWRPKVTIQLQNQCWPKSLAHLGRIVLGNMLTRNLEFFTEEFKSKIQNFEQCRTGERAITKSKLNWQPLLGFLSINSSCVNNPWL